MRCACRCVCSRLYNGHYTTLSLLPLSLDVLSFVSGTDHYVLNHQLACNLYGARSRGYVPLARVPCEMSDVLANDKCRRRYRVSDLAVRTPN